LTTAIPASELLRPHVTPGRDYGKYARGDEVAANLEPVCALIELEVEAGPKGEDRGGGVQYMQGMVV
jgi:hypothetical protein